MAASCQSWRGTKGHSRPGVSFSRSAAEAPIATEQDDEDVAGRATNVVVELAVIILRVVK